MALVQAGSEGRSIRSSADFGEWVSALTLNELAEPFTFVVDGGGVLRLAPRRSEHVVCAGGGEVLSAGESRCRSCRELNIVREENFVCVFCGEDLPRKWSTGGPGDWSDSEDRITVRGAAAQRCDR